MSITTWYAICAVIGGTVLLVQFAMTLIGVGDADDLPDDFPESDPTSLGDGDHGPDILGILSFRTIVAALAFFGVTGLALSPTGLRTEATFVAALAVGAGAMYGVWYLMQLLVRLKSDGTVRIERAVGTTGTVYLSIPGHRRGAGKVSLKLQNRLCEFAAMTAGEALPTGASIVVVEIVNPETVEVEAVGARKTHSLPAGSHR